MSNTVIEAVSAALCFIPADYYAQSNETRVVLVSGAHDILMRHQEALKQADDNCWLDRLLNGLLHEAPTQEGQKHVAIVLHIVEKRHGVDGVIKAAKAWFENMIMPLRGDFADYPEERFDTPPLIEEEEGPLLDDEDDDIGESNINEGKVPEDHEADPEDLFRHKVAEREGYRCVITKAFDNIRVFELYDSGREAEIPRDVSYRALVQAAYIIPFIRDDGTSELTDTSLESSAVFRNREDVTLIWNLLQAWATGIDIPYMAGKDIHSPANGIYMSAAMQSDFQAYCIYFDKDAYPQSPMKYKVRHIKPGVTLPDGYYTQDVEFGTTGTTIEPPNPEYLQVHASLCKALHSHGCIFKEVPGRCIHDLQFE